MINKETQKIIDDYYKVAEAVEPPTELTGNLVFFLQVWGWEFHKPGQEFPRGIMVHPDLASHDDWMDCIEEWDDYYEEPVSYYCDYIQNLINSPVFAGDNDWSEHIIKL